MGKLFEELKRRKVFRVTAVYAVVAWVLIQVADVVLPTFGAPDWVGQTIIFLFILGLPLTVVLAWAYDVTPGGIKSGSAEQDVLSSSTAASQPINYIILAIVLLVAGFQVADRFVLNSRSEVQITQNNLPISSQTVARSTINLGTMGRLVNGRRTEFVISPDGTQLVYFAVQEGREKIYLRQLDQLESRVLAEFDYSLSPPDPTFSPNGQWVAFHNGNSLEKISVLGGSSQIVTDESGIRTDSPGSFWTEDDTILFRDSPGQYNRIASAGGSSEPLKISTADDAAFFSHPHVLPGGRYALIQSNTGFEMAIELITLETGASRTLLEGGSVPRYARSGHIVFLQDGDLWAAPFDIENLELAGEARPVLVGERISVYSFSEDGRLIYLPDSFGADDYRLGNTLSIPTWVDREGNQTTIDLEPRAYRSPKISPDGEYLLLEEVGFNVWNTWKYDLNRKILSRNPELGGWATWFPDGDNIAYRRSIGGLFSIRSDWSGQPDQLTSSPFLELPGSFSPDSNTMAFSRQTGISFDVYVQSLDEESEPEPLIATDALEIWPAISPNGKWIAYVSDESGRAEIYVRPFPNVDDGKWQISPNGGDEPYWSEDGLQLFYLAGGGPATTVTAVAIELEPSFTPGIPEELFSGYFSRSFIANSYHVFGNGEKFLMLKPLEQTGESYAPADVSLVLVENWFEELRRMAPPDVQ